MKNYNYSYCERYVIHCEFCRLYKIAAGLMLAHPYGVTRVMSNYRWDRHFVNGKVNTFTKHDDILKSYTGLDPHA